MESNLEQRIPKIENRHIRCQNPACRSCKPRRVTNVLIKPLESVRESRQVAISRTE